MNEPRLCSNCGAQVSADAPAGNCPDCLFALAAALATESSSAGAPPPPPGGRGQDTCAFPAAFGNYELIEEIARGGMGVVYRARQISLNRMVAVKVLLFGQFASDEFVQRFRSEAAAVASLHHPNIVAIHEIGEHDGRQFFSMDYVAGEHLGEAVRQQPLPARRAAALMRTIAGAVQHAHQRGVLHRDLKPSNILIDAGGEPRLTDFGIAKRLTSNPGAGAGSADLTLTGQMLGTPGYAAPDR